MQPIAPKQLPVQPVTPKQQGRLSGPHKLVVNKMTEEEDQVAENQPVEASDGVTGKNRSGQPSMFTCMFHYVCGWVCKKSPIPIFNFDKYIG